MVVRCGFVFRQACRGDVFQASNNEGGPTRLVAGANAAAGVPVEVLVEQHQVLPRFVGGVPGIVAMTRTMTAVVRYKEATQAPGQLSGDVAGTLSACPRQPSRSISTASVSTSWRRGVMANGWRWFPESSDRLQQPSAKVHHGALLYRCGLAEFGVEGYSLAP